MAHQYARTMFTDAVKQLQERMRSRASYARMEEMGGNNELGFQEAEFVAERDSFYMASVNSDGWPYVQHRGGPRGFLRVLDSRTLAFADFAGNKQYISAGNFVTNDRVALFLMDYPNQTRLKIEGHAHIVEPEDPEFAALEPKVALNGYKAKVERLIRIELVGFDWNCSQHITPRWTQEEIEAATAEGARPSV